MHNSEIVKPTPFWRMLWFLENIMPLLSRIRAKILILSIEALVWADKLVDLVLWVMVKYLISEWNLDITQASAIVTGFTGVEAIMPLGMAFLADAYIGVYSTLFYSCLAYSFGLTILTISINWRTSSGHVDGTQNGLFFTALALKAVGVSGFEACSSRFWEQRKRILADDLNEKRCGKFKRFRQKFLFPLVGFVVGFLISAAPFEVSCGMAAVGMVTATFLLKSGPVNALIRSGSGKWDEPQGSPLTTVCRVFVSSASKMFHLPKLANELCEEECQSSLHFLPHTQGLRWLDKAANKLQTQTPEKKHNRWRLCRVTEVEETKIFMRMIPMWTTFIMSGVVSSMGDTYFLEQASNTKEMAKYSVFIFIGLQIFSKATTLALVKLCRIASKRLTRRGSGKYVAIIGISVATLCSIGCCSTAANVERRRLDVIKSHDLMDKPGAYIPMSVWWLLPQFFLLAAHDGITEYICDDLDEASGYSIACFFNGQVPASIIPYLKVLTKGAFGVGAFGSLGLVYAFGKVSESGGKPSWFRGKLNESRLDNYYRTVAVLSFANLLFCIWVATWYTDQHSANRESKVPEHEASCPV